MDEGMTVALSTRTPEVLSREPYGHAVDWWSLGVISCRMLTDKYPAPAIGKKANADIEGLGNNAVSVSNNKVSSFDGIGVHAQQQHRIQPTAGTLPDNAASLSNAARGLLMRLLERDPRVRIRNLRQLQQSAFYMGFNIEHVKAKKVSPKAVLQKHFPNGPGERNPNDLHIASQNAFLSFDQPTLV